jgi:hypothetical protein
MIESATVWIWLQAMPVKRSILILPRHGNMIWIKLTAEKAKPDRARDSGRTLPDQHPIPVYLPHPVQRNSACFPSPVYDLKGKGITGDPDDLAEGHADNFIFQPVVKAYRKEAAAELPVPADTVQQFMNGLHGLYIASVISAKQIL